MRKYKAIIYDVDGTLLDTLKMNMVPLLQILHEEGFTDFTYDTVLRYASYPGRKVLEELGVDNMDEVYQRWVRYVNEYSEEASIFPGVIDLLKQVGFKETFVLHKHFNFAAFGARKNRNHIDT